MAKVLLCFFVLYSSSLVTCTDAPAPDALDLILGTKNFYQGHQPSSISWEYLTSAVLELINEEIDQLEAASRNPSSLTESVYKLFRRRFEMFYPDLTLLTAINSSSKTGFRVVADVEEVFVKPMDFVTVGSKICTVSSNDHILTDTSGMIVRVSKVGKRIDFSAPHSLAYIVKFGDKYPNADKAAIQKWIDIRKQARSTSQIGKKVSTQLIPHLNSYHPNVLDEC